MPIKSADYEAPAHPVLDFFINILKPIVRGRKKVFYALLALMALIILVGVVGLITLQKISLFLVATAIVFAANFIIIRYHLNIDFAPTLFFSIIIAKSVGIIYVIPFLLISEIIVFFPAKSVPGPLTGLYLLWLLIISIVALFFPLSPMVGVILTLIYAAGRLFLSFTFKGGIYGVASSIGALIINAWLFFSFTNYFANLFA